MLYVLFFLNAQSLVVMRVIVTESLHSCAQMFHQQKTACFVGCIELTGWKGTVSQDMIGSCVLISYETFKW